MDGRACRFPPPSFVASMKRGRRACVFSKDARRTGGDATMPWKHNALRGSRASILAAAAMVSLTTSAHAQAGPWSGGTEKIAGRYADVNGIKLYYEVHGTGRPLVLLHGGLGAIEMFGPNLAA